MKRRWPTKRRDMPCISCRRPNPISIASAARSCSTTATPAGRFRRRRNARPTPRMAQGDRGAAPLRLPCHAEGAVPSRAVLHRGATCQRLPELCRAGPQGRGDRAGDQRCSAASRRSCRRATSPAVDALAADCTTIFDAFRAPMSPQERARRLASGLNPSQIANLDRWGYPYLFADFRFHMTLTGKIEAGRRDADGRDAAPCVPRGCCGARPIAIDRLALVKQDDAGRGLSRAEPRAAAPAQPEFRAAASAARPCGWWRPRSRHRTTRSSPARTR